MNTNTVRVADEFKKSNGLTDALGQNTGLEILSVCEFELKPTVCGFLLVVPVSGECMFVCVSSHFDLFPE